MRTLQRIVWLVFLLGSVLTASGQNNMYQLDEECYVYFRKADSLVGKDEFKAVNDTLLRLSLQKGDTKAQTLYYVERLHHYIELSRQDHDDERVDQALQELKEVSLRLGYRQYYYYGIDLTQNYYYNTGRKAKAMELIQEMQTHALETDDEYGKWMTDRLMAVLYVAQNDFVSARSYLERALDTYHETADSLIRRQSVCQLYCELADVYPVGSDSVILFLNKAVENQRLFLDTLRCQYSLARQAAFEGDMARYRTLRDECLNSGNLDNVTTTGARLFDMIDAIFNGTIDSRLSEISKFHNLRDWGYIATLLQKNGYRNYALGIYQQLVEKMEDGISVNNQSRITEVEARIGNMSLEASLREQSTRMDRVNRLVLIFGFSTLLIIILFMLAEVAHSRRNKTRDAERIEELKEANAHAVAADEAKTQFVQNMSHEIRTPLNAIVGFSQLLSLPDGSFPEEEKEGFATHIVNNAQMLTMLLDDILNASAIDNNEYRIVYEEGEMHFLCKAAISSAEHRLQPGVELRYEPESEEPFTFRTDPRRVQQILINMLTNACKHTTQGEIVLSSSLEANPGYVTFAVTDTGSGVPPEQAEVIFERFVKLNGFVQGTGLGLSICREIAKRMGAKIYLDTTYTAGGARFIFMVPVTPPVV